MREGQLKQGPVLTAVDLFRETSVPTAESSVADAAPHFQIQIAVLSVIRQRQVGRQGPERTAR